jgi:hypothetical protein
MLIDKASQNHVVQLVANISVNSEIASNLETCSSLGLEGIFSSIQEVKNFIILIENIDLFKLPTGGLLLLRHNLSIQPDQLAKDLYMHQKRKM